MTSWFAKTTKDCSDLFDRQRISLKDDQTLNLHFYSYLKKTKSY